MLSTPFVRTDALSSISTSIALNLFYHLLHNLLKVPLILLADFRREILYVPMKIITHKAIFTLLKALPKKENDIDKFEHEVINNAAYLINTGLLSRNLEYNKGFFIKVGETIIKKFLSKKRRLQVFF